MSNDIYRRKRHRAAPHILTDKRARTFLDRVVPVTWANGVGHRWKFVEETRTNSKTLAYIYQDPFNLENERVFAVDFRDGTLKDLGPARRRAMRAPKQLPAPPKPLLLPPPANHAPSTRRKVAGLLGEALLRRLFK